MCVLVILHILIGVVWSFDRSLLATFVWNTTKLSFYIFIKMNVSLNHRLNHSTIVDNFFSHSLPIFFATMAYTGTLAMLTTVKNSQNHMEQFGTSTNAALNRSSKVVKHPMFSRNNPISIPLMLDSIWSTAMKWSWVPIRWLDYRISSVSQRMPLCFERWCLCLHRRSIKSKND